MSNETSKTNLPAPRHHATERGDFITPGYDIVKFMIKESYCFVSLRGFAWHLLQELDSRQYSVQEATFSLPQCIHLELSHSRTSQALEIISTGVKR
jgi:hypothetical protein